MNPDILGYIASFLSCITFLPQIFKTWQSKSVKDISVASFSIVCLSTIIWFVYGFMVKSNPVMLTNAIVFISSVIMLFLKWRHS